MFGAPEDNAELASLQQPYQGELSGLAAQARTQKTHVVQQIDDELAEDLRRWNRIGAQNVRLYPQTWLGGVDVLGNAVDYAGQDTQFDGGIGFDAYTGSMGLKQSMPPGVAALDVPWRFDMFSHGRVDGRTNAASGSFSSLSNPRGLETTLLASSQAPEPDLQYPYLDMDMDETAYQHVLPTTEKCEMQPNHSEGQAKSAALSKALSEARSKRIASLIQPLSTKSANIPGPHLDNDRFPSPPDMSQIDQHTFLDAHEVEHVDDAPQQAPNAAGEKEVLDIESFLQSHTASQPKPIQRNHRPEQRNIHHISQIVVDICRGPRKQRESETVRLLTSLGLSPSQQQSAFKILHDLIVRNKKTKNDADPIVFRKWLCLLIYDVQIRASAANSTSKNINEAKIKGLFCKEGIHQLKCGHTSYSNEECGMNCVIFSSYPDTPIIDVRMSEIYCNECGNWR